MAAILMVTSPRRVFLLTKPSPKRIERFLAQQRNRTFSYREVGHSRRGAPAEPTAPAGYRTDHNRVRLGEGRAAFARAVDALRSWKMFDLGWVAAFPAGAPLEPGTTVAIRVRHYGFWSLNACRIVYSWTTRGPSSASASPTARSPSTPSGARSASASSGTTRTARSGTTSSPSRSPTSPWRGSAPPSPAGCRNVSSATPMRAMARAAIAQVPR